MIRLKQVSTVYGEATLIFEADGFPEGIREVKIPLAEVVERLKTVKQVLGRQVTLQDARLAIIKIVNDLRQTQTPIPERFDFTPYIGKDLEGEG
ncbi:MAG: hypothetical protein QXH20_06875 [Candidatus Bathyarchaeia archaeon]